jgi:hypothetical protein
MEAKVCCASTCRRMVARLSLKRRHQTRAGGLAVGILGGGLCGVRHLWLLFGAGDVCQDATLERQRRAVGVPDYVLGAGEDHFHFGSDSRLLYLGIFTCVLESSRTMDIT